MSELQHSKRQHLLASLREQKEKNKNLIHHFESSIDYLEVSTLMEEDSAGKKKFRVISYVFSDETQSWEVHETEAGSLKSLLTAHTKEVLRLHEA